MGVRVRQLDQPSAGRWDRFVREHPQATFFHLSGWKAVIEGSFRHPSPFLYAERDGDVTGVLPLVHVKSRLFGNALVSSSFCVYGGPVCRDEESREALDRAAGELADRFGVDYLEYRCRRRLHADWPCRDDLYATFRKALDPDPDKNLQRVRRKQRAMVRKAIKAGLVSQFDRDPERFFRVYSESVRDLGTPVFAKSYFRNLMAEFGPSCSVLTITAGDRPVSSVLSFYFRDEVLPYYGGGTAEARELAANDFMYWELMRRSCEAGYRIFDFGRSKRGTGAFAFKEHWGFAPEPVYHEYVLRRTDRMPEVNPLNPKYRLFIALWRRLPLAVANRLGPLIVRNLG